MSINPERVVALLDWNGSPFFGRFPPMPQSLSAVFVHVVLSTKQHRPWLQDPIVRAASHQYLGGLAEAIAVPHLEALYATL